jgi:hypothetical protein
MRRNGVKQIIYSPATMAQKKQIKIASTIEERRESEEQTWYARKERERELVQSRELADGHHIHPRGHLHVAICYA